MNFNTFKRITKNLSLNIILIDRKLIKEMAETEWKCRKCDRNFETRGQRDGHNRRKHQKRVINSNLGDRDAIIERVEGDKFVCQCQTTFTYAWSLQRHKRKCNASFLMIENESENSENEEGTRQFIYGVC